MHSSSFSSFSYESSLELNLSLIKTQLTILFLLPLSWAFERRREITCDDRKTYLIYAISLVFIPLSYEDSNGRRFSLSTFDSNLRILRPRTLFYSILCRMLTCKERLLLLVMYSGYCNSGYSVLS